MVLKRGLQLNSSNIERHFNFLINCQRYCYGYLRVRTALISVSLVDALFWSALVLRGIYFFFNVSSSALTTSWLTFTVPICLVAYVSLLTTLLAVRKRRYYLLLPQFVVKITTLSLCIVFTFALFALAFMQPQKFADVLTPFYLPVDTLQMKQFIRIGASIFLVVSFLFVGLEIWLLLILCKCYQSYRILYIMCKLYSRPASNKLEALTINSLV
ncbi:hypothetical protein D918_08428 [Trichuris suis]|nr:hypothetical protein D918_08428 [Trichuris suis]